MSHDLLKTLLLCAEKACKVARSCRQKESLFSLLIQEKDQRNNELDFKTLADVFIQELVRYEVKKKFPLVAKNLKGEESCRFTNTLGETIEVAVKENCSQTEALLLKVLNKNANAARILAECAHDDVTLSAEQLPDVSIMQKLKSSGFDVKKAGIWIDPIDCTSEYVKGVDTCTVNNHGCYENGLQCVTVLIGVYDLTTGVPVIGLISQPFGKKSEDNTGWISACYWGFSYGDTRVNNVTINPPTTNCLRPVCVRSVHENSEILGAINCVSDTVATRGAGYKFLCVIQGHTQAFVYSKNGTYKWDSCGPHAVLSAMGGGVASFNKVLEAVKNGSTAKEALKQSAHVYDVENPTNFGGLIGYLGNIQSQNAVADIINSIRIKSVNL